MDRQIVEISDDLLVDELKKRLNEKNVALFDLKALTKNLELMNTKLEESERLKSFFLSNIKNEINNPLTALITLSGELTEIGIGDLEKYKKVSKMVHSEVLNLDFQIRNILTSAELEAGDAFPQYTRVDVNSVIDNAIKNLRPIIEDNSVTIEIEERADTWMNTDSDMLGVLVSNIIANGIIFNKDYGVLHISVSIHDELLVIKIRDEGIGIDESNQKIIFDRFRQLDRGVTKRFRGHGLGLSVSQAIADLLNGSIEVESTLGEGSTFTVILPVNSGLEVDGSTFDGAELFFSDDDEDDEGEEF